MHLMRSLFFLAVQQDITLVAQHIPGVENREADALPAMTIFAQNTEDGDDTPPGAGASIGPAVPGLDFTELGKFAKSMFTCSQRALQTPPSGVAKTDSFLSVRGRD